MTDPEIQIRAATVEDAAEIARLLHDFNEEYEEQTPPAPELTRHAERMLREGEMTVLLAGEGPDGLALLRFRPSVWTEQQEAYLQELYVVPPLRGQGIGEALMRAVLATCRQRDAAWIELNTGETDTAARGLYAKLGFTNEEGPQGTSMLYYELEL
ncbi:MAG TPA: GNAT family N-acetyltransferase [Solirubrobacterales bacterium]|jgi:ribosomal protein S18 acetylase RimI-like enzyme|nr:GNAT family N-acetyltransferase [Solirubrobacterales bacterium]